MQLVSNSLTDQESVPVKFAFAEMDPENHVALSTNLNPHLAWKKAPGETRSFAVVCVDPDAPSAPDDVNQDDREVPADLPRVNFYHWTLFDIPVEQTEIAEGAHSDVVTPRGKSSPKATGGLRHGLNDYTAWFAGDEDMKGDYFGYDGPCPPWNDSVVHRYIFTVYALDVEKLPVGDDLSGAAIAQLIEQHALEHASLTTSYTLNPRLAE